MSIFIILTYFFITLIIGFHFNRQSRRRTGDSGVDFFLAGRSLRPLLLFVTMAATNFSAFTIFGLSGSGYRNGYAFYPLMAFGTGFMALTLSLIHI